MKAVNSQPLVSVIIIFLNGESFIEEAIASIFAQTYDYWELLLVDDGSTDGSTAIAQKYMQKFPEKVRYLQHENHQNCGMSASRNLGITHAQGDYIAFLDADDIWLPQKLAQQLAIFNAYPEAAMVYGRVKIWYSWTEKFAANIVDHFYDLGVQPNTLIQPPLLFLVLLKNKYQTPTPSNPLIRREVFKEIGKFETSFRTMFEDQVFFSKIFLNAPVFVSDECWSKYRQHPESCTSQFLAHKYYLARRPFIAWLGNYLSAQNVQNIQVWRAFRRGLWECRHPIMTHVFNRIQHHLNNFLSFFYPQKSMIKN